jgi:hypothetical protein
MIGGKGQKQKISADLEQDHFKKPVPDDVSQPK